MHYITTNQKEGKMLYVTGYILGILTILVIPTVYFILDNITVTRDSGPASRACSFDCYDEGGCPLCSTWHEWEDADYGTIGEWVPNDAPADFEPWHPDRNPRLDHPIHGALDNHGTW